MEDMIEAAARGNEAAVSALLTKGAPLDARDAEGRTAMMAATYGHHTSVVALLLKADADPNIRDDKLSNPLLHAGAEGHLDILELVAGAADPT